MPPRCPACHHRLDGSTFDGACPECGATYVATTRHEYARPVGLVGTMLAWWWPVGLVVVPIALAEAWARVSDAELKAPLRFFIVAAYVVLAAVALVNGARHAYIWHRQRELSRPDVASFRATPLVVGTSIGCGLLASVGTLIVATAIGAAAFFLSR